MTRYPPTPPIFVDCPHCRRPAVWTGRTNTMQYERFKMLYHCPFCYLDCVGVLTRATQIFEVRPTSDDDPPDDWYIPLPAY